MVLEGLNITVTDVLTSVSGAILERITWLATLIKAVGIFVIIYAFYLIIKAGRDIKMRSRIKAIDKKMDSVNAKMDLILESSSKKKKQAKAIDKSQDLEDNKRSIFEKIKDWTFSKSKKSDNDVVVNKKLKSAKKSKK
ncbi:hypothetical protein HN747_04550 [archaeon]|jgi:hypothetical protein|nr:hypothetical protein [archaeon]